MAKPRASSLILIIALILSVLAAGNFYLGRNAERAKRIWLEDQLQKITAAKEALEKERDELTKAKEAMETQLNGQIQTLTEQAKQMSEEVAQEKRARETLTGEVANLKGRVDTERKEKLTLTGELAKTKQSYQALSNELTTLRQAKEALERRVKEMLTSQASEAEKIVVKPAAKAAQMPAKPLEGKVLVVNREFNFVVVNLGTKDGLKVGADLSIWRDKKAVAKVQVERIYDNMAAATLLTEEQKGQVQEGDLVRAGS